jgi:orotidine-5'-phosphate decarboxylase
MADSRTAQTFLDRLDDAGRRSGSCLCIGLDPDLALFPTDAGLPSAIEERIVAFNVRIIEATHAHASAFKVNLAFYERFGADGWRALERTVRAIPRDIPTIADAKRGDIGNTARFYAEAFFEHLSFDACTISPYMGFDSIEPFGRYPGKGVFVLCRTSNSSADDFQLHGQERPLYLDVARRAVEWSDKMPGTVGLVVGATRPTDLAAVRAEAPETVFLVPGVGAQGADAAETVRVGRGSSGRLIVNSSRSILYASSGSDFAEAAESEARRLKAALVGL